MDNILFMKKYAYSQSILHVTCINKDSDLPAIFWSISENDIKLIVEALRAYEKFVETKTFGNHFLKQEQNRLKFLDMFLDIPVLCIFYQSSLDYRSFSELLEMDNFTIIESKPYDKNLIEGFYSRGNRREFDYLLSRGKISLDDRLTYCLARGNNLQLVKYARELGCSWEPGVTYYAALHGNLELFKYAIEDGCQLDDSITSAAACSGNLDCLKYARELGCVWDENTTATAAKNGHLDCLRYAHENGCPWTSVVTEYAARFSYLDCLRYAHENGCPWTSVVTEYAAAGNGHLDCIRRSYLDCLRYAHENGCPWDDRTTLAATKWGKLECLQYAYENGCPLNIEECLKYSYFNCKKWLLKLKNQS